jgi:hypothetical protein
MSSGLLAYYDRLLGADARRLSARSNRSMAVRDASQKVYGKALSDEVRWWQPITPVSLAPLWHLW